MSHPQLSTILNVNPDVDWRSQPMFFGQQLGLARTDQQRYPVFARLTEEQYSNFWRPHDVNLLQDRADFQTLPENIRHVFVNNLAYQSLLDSAQSRATIFALLPWVSCPELEACIKVWGFFEEIHNKAYEYVLKNLYVDPTPFFDGILRNTNIMVRASAICRHYNTFIQYSDRVKVFGYDRNQGLSKRQHKKLLYLMIVSIYVLEALRFFVSFTCTFAIGQMNLMLGNAKEMKLIARDETLHVGISLNILRLLPREDPEFLAIASECKDEVYAIFREAVAQEAEWAGYLLDNNAMLGLNTKLMVQSIESRANSRLKAIGMDQVFEARTDPFARLMATWMSTANEQSAPQETEIDSYKVSAMDMSVDASQLMTDF